MRAFHRILGISLALVCASLALTQVVSAQGSNLRATPSQVRNAMWLRALQARSGGGRVQMGAPQFVPFGNMMGMPQGFPDTSAPAATNQDKADKKDKAAKKADYEAARAERKQKTQERAAKRKADAAARRVANGQPAKAAAAKP